VLEGPGAGGLLGGEGDLNIDTISCRDVVLFFLVWYAYASTLKSVIFWGMN